MHDPDLDAATAGLLALAEYNIPVDVQELLVRGDPMRGIKQGALSAAFKAAILSYRRTQLSPDLKDSQQPTVLD